MTDDPIHYVRRYTDPKSQESSDKFMQSRPIKLEPMKSKDPGRYWDSQFEKAFPNV